MSTSDTACYHAAKKHVTQPHKKPYPVKERQCQFMPDTIRQTGRDKKSPSKNDRGLVHTNTKDSIKLSM